MEAHFNRLSKGALLLAGLGFSDNDHESITRAIGETWLLHFRHIATEVLCERLPNYLAEPYCHYVLLKGVQDPKNNTYFDRDHLTSLFLGKATELETLMGNDNVPYRDKEVVNRLLTKLHLPEFKFERPTLAVVG